MSVHEEAFFCGISPLGPHFDEEMKVNIWWNQYIDIWSLMTVDQHTIDRECRVYTVRPRVAKTMGNWLHAFLVLGCMMGQKHPERCSELFIYMDLVYSAYKFHGGNVWWQHNEELH